MEGAACQEMWGLLGEAALVATRKEKGSQSYNHKELNSATTKNGLGSVFFPRVPR